MKDFKIPEVVLPTEEELTRYASEWAERVGPTFIDQWPPELLALSAPTEFVEIQRDIIDIFEAHAWAELDDTAGEIDRICGWTHKFFRLNSRSTKDNSWPLESPVTCSGREMLMALAGSMRAFDDLCVFKRSPVSPKLCLREFWPGVNPANEYRCFLKDGDVLAVAEYRNRLSAGWNAPTEDRDRETRAAIDEYLSDHVIPRLHIKTVVVDLCQPNAAWRLLEINPFGLSDPVGAVSYDRIENGIPGIARLTEAEVVDLEETP